MLLDEPTQPPRSREPDLAGALPQGLRGRAGHDLARSRVHEPHRQQDRRDRRRRADQPTPATTTSTSSSARSNEKQQQAQFERQQAMLAKEMQFIERFKARATHAAQVQSARQEARQDREASSRRKRRQTVAFEFPPAPRSGDDVVQPRRACTRATAARAIYDGLDFMVRRQRALVRDGRQRRRQVDAAQAGRRRDRSRTTAR